MTVDGISRSRRARGHGSSERPTSRCATTDARRTARPLARALTERTRRVSRWPPSCPSSIRTYYCVRCADGPRL